MTFRLNTVVFTIVAGLASFSAVADYYQADAALIDVKKRMETINSAITATEIPGEQINLSNRQLGWDVVDLSIPGNGPLIEISRRHATTTPGWFDHWRREMYNWELSIPKVDVGLWRYVEDQDQAKDIMRNCGYGNVKSVDVRIRGAGDFRPIAKNTAVSYPSEVHTPFNNNWLLKCKQTVSTRSVSTTSTGAALPGTVSNAITLLSPDGLTYTFAYQAVEHKLLPVSPPKTHGSWASWTQMVYQVKSFYVTDIEDRFGNHVTYHYEQRPDNNNGTVLRLKKVTASDGRLVELEYQTDQHGQTGVNNSGRHLKRVVSGSQSVSYAYGTTTQQVPQLKKVTDGGNRFWLYNYYEGLIVQNSLVKDVTTPWGAKVSYIYKTSRTGNSVCGNWINGSNTDGVYQRKVTIGAEQYNYEYSDYAGSVGALTTWVTEVKEPNAVKKYHHACYNSQTLPESAVEHAKAMALVRQDVLGSSGTLLRRTDSTWQTIAYSGPVRRQRTVDTTVSTLRLYKQKEVITEDSGTYTTEWLAPDIYGLPATVLKSSNQLTDKLYTRQTYTHFPTLWLIGLPGTLELSADGVSWVTKEETSYYGVNHSAQAKPYQVKLYGNLQKTYASYHPDGLIKRINYNEGSQRWLQLDDYKFGQPQRIKVPQRYSTSCTNPDTCFSLIQQTINDDGWLSKFTDLNQNCTNYTYDSLGRLRSSSPCDNRWAATTFDYATEENSTVLTETRGGYKRQSTFDGLMREVLTKEWDITSPAESRIIRRTFDDSNNLVFASYPSDNETETQGTVYQYDALQRKTSEYDTVSQKGNSWSYQYGNKLIETDANNYVTTTTFKALGRPDYSLPTRVEQPEGAVTSISYTLFDAMNSVQQGSITELRRYNARQQLCLVKRPDTGLTIYTYNNLGQILSSAEGLSGNGTVCSDYTNQSTARINHSYDNLGALKSITYADGSPGKVFTLDRQGNLTKLSAGTAVWDYSYNSLNLVESEILTVDNQSWLLDPSYNSLGHQISLLYPSGESVDYAPNALGQPTKAGTYATNAKYYPNGQLKNFNYGNGLLFTQALDARKRPSELLVKKGTSVRVGQSYGYDDRNNITAITDQTNPANNIGLGYDGLERLVTASGYWGAGSVSYDVLGNIKSKTLGTQALTYNYNNSTNRLTSVTGGYSFSYDGRGTVTNNGKRNFSVNRANQMTSSGAISYVYDGHNRRVKKVNGAGTQYSFYSQSGQFLSTTGSQGPTEFIYLGSKLVAQVSQVSTTDDKPGYTGHLEDKDIGLTYMQQRYYDPVIGRFYSNDPVGFTPSNPMMFNRYAYANNNPYKYIDPDGRAPDVVVDAAFTIYDAGQTLGAAAAYVEGVVTGNEALTAVAGEGLASSATNLAISAVSMAVPGASAPMLRTASQVKTEVKVLKNGEKQVTSKDTKTSFANKLESRGYEKGTNAKGDAHYTKGDVKYTLKSYPGDKKDTAYRNAGDRQTHKIRLQKDE